MHKNENAESHKVFSQQKKPVVIIKHQREQTTKQERTDSPPDEYAHMKKSSEFVQLTEDIQQRKKQELIESLHHSSPLDHHNRNSMPNQIQRGRINKDQDVTSRHLQQRFEEILEQHTGKNTQEVSREDQLNKMTHMLLQEKDKYEALNLKILQYKEELKRYKSDNELIKNSLKDQRKAYEDLKYKYQVLMQNQEVMQDEKQTWEQEKNELSHSLMQKDTIIKELQRLSDRPSYCVCDSQSSKTQASGLQTTGRNDWDSNINLQTDRVKNRLYLEIEEKNRLIAQKDSQIKMLFEKQAKLSKNLTDSKLEWQSQKDLWAKLTTEYQKLQDSVKNDGGQSSKILKELNELKLQNKELQDQLQRAQIVIEELQCRNETKETHESHDISNLRLSHDNFLNHKSELKEETPAFFLTPGHKPIIGVPSSRFSAMNKSPSINSLGSCLSQDKKLQMDRFNKMTGATVGLMSSYMDYQSLSSYSKQAEQSLKAAKIDISSAVAKRRESTDFQNDGN